MTKQSINDFLTKKIKDNSNSKIECLNLCLKIEKEGIENINITHYDNDDFKNEMMSYFNNKEYHDKSNANI